MAETKNQSLKEQAIINIPEQPVESPVVARRGIITSSLAREKTEQNLNRLNQFLI